MRTGTTVIRRRRTSEKPKAVKRIRTRLAVPKTPPGFLNNPPEELCGFIREYNPNPLRYQTVTIVDYVCCHRSCPVKISMECERKIEQDSGTKARIRRIKNGFTEEED